MKGVHGRVGERRRRQRSGGGVGGSGRVVGLHMGAVRDARVTRVGGLRLKGRKAREVEKRGGAVVGVADGALPGPEEGGRAPYLFQVECVVRVWYPRGRLGPAAGEASVVAHSDDVQQEVELVGPSGESKRWGVALCECGADLALCRALARSIGKSWSCGYNGLLVLGGSEEDGVGIGMLGMQAHRPGLCRAVLTYVAGLWREAEENEGGSGEGDGDGDGDGDGHRERGWRLGIGCSQSCGRKVVDLMEEIVESGGGEGGLEKKEGERVVLKCVEVHDADQAADFLEQCHVLAQKRPHWHTMICLSLYNIATRRVSFLHIVKLANVSIADDDEDVVSKEERKMVADDVLGWERMLERAGEKRKVGRRKSRGGSGVFVMKRRKDRKGMVRIERKGVLDGSFGSMGAGKSVVLRLLGSQLSGLSRTILVTSIPQFGSTIHLTNTLLLPIGAQIQRSLVPRGAILPSPDHLNFIPPPSLHSSSHQEHPPSDPSPSPPPPPPPSTSQQQHPPSKDVEEHLAEEEEKEEGKEDSGIEGETDEVGTGTVDEGKGEEGGEKEGGEEEKGGGESDGGEGVGREREGEEVDGGEEDGEEKEDLLLKLQLRMESMETLKKKKKVESKEKGEKSGVHLLSELHVRDAVHRAGYPPLPTTTTYPHPLLSHTHPSLVRMEEEGESEWREKKSIDSEIEMLERAPSTSEISSHVSRVVDAIAEDIARSVQRYQLRHTHPQPPPQYASMLEKTLESEHQAAPPSRRHRRRSRQPGEGIVNPHDFPSSSLPSTPSTSSPSSYSTVPNAPQLPHTTSWAKPFDPSSLHAHQLLALQSQLSEPSLVAAAISLSHASPPPPPPTPPHSPPRRRQDPRQAPSLIFSPSPKRADDDEWDESDSEERSVDGRETRDDFLPLPSSTSPRSPKPHTRPRTETISPSPPHPHPHPPFPEPPPVPRRRLLRVHDWLVTGKARRGEEGKHGGGDGDGDGDGEGKVEGGRKEESGVRVERSFEKKTLEEREKELEAELRELTRRKGKGGKWERRRERSEEASFLHADSSLTQVPHSSSSLEELARVEIGSGEVGGEKSWSSDSLEERRGREWRKKRWEGMEERVRAAEARAEAARKGERRLVRQMERLARGRAEERALIEKEKERRVKAELEAKRAKHQASIAAHATGEAMAAASFADAHARAVRKGFLLE